MKHNARTKHRIYSLFNKEGYTRRFIARALEIPYSTVCLIIKELQVFETFNPLF